MALVHFFFAFETDFISRKNILVETFSQPKRAGLVTVRHLMYTLQNRLNDIINDCDLKHIMQLDYEREIFMRW